MYVCTISRGGNNQIILHIYMYMCMISRGGNNQIILHICMYMCTISRGGNNQIILHRYMYVCTISRSGNNQIIIHINMYMCTISRTGVAWRSESQAHSVHWWMVCFAQAFPQISQVFTVVSLLFFVLWSLFPTISCKQQWQRRRWPSVVAETEFMLSVILCIRCWSAQNNG